MERIYTLPEVCERLKWSRRSLLRALNELGIGTIGTGRLARLTESDVQKLMDGLRQAAEPPSLAPGAPLEGRRILTQGERIRAGKVAAAAARARMARRGKW